jgi:hypothetical protein
MWHYASSRVDEGLTVGVGGDELKRLVVVQPYLLQKRPEIALEILTYPSFAFKPRSTFCRWPIADELERALNRMSSRIHEPRIRLDEQRKGSSAFSGGRLGRPWWIPLGVPWVSHCSPGRLVSSPPTHTS